MKNQTPPAIRVFFFSLMLLGILYGCTNQTGESSPGRPAFQDEEHKAKSDIVNDLPLKSSVNQECEALIDSLKASNRMPLPSSNEIGRPRDVEEVMKRLLSYGNAAFPALIEHIGDADLSYHAEGIGNSSPGPHPYSVGYVCRNVIEMQIDMVQVNHKGRTGRDGEFHSISYFNSHNMNEWWKNHQSMTLGEMRLEVVNWYIQEEERIGFATLAEKDLCLKPLLDLQANIRSAPQKPKEFAPVSSYP